MKIKKELLHKNQQSEKSLIAWNEGQKVVRKIFLCLFRTLACESQLDSSFGIHLWCPLFSWDFFDTLSTLCVLLPDTLSLGWKQSVVTKSYIIITKSIFSLCPKGEQEKIEVHLSKYVVPNNMKNFFGIMYDSWT